ncbi:MAG: hypothetical protein B7X76_02240 [Azorhizobium sp. 39-67-5]|nr:MAG: hypothetical protein B7X76_02240 [Azorhizobium sp. 39-67-5]
MAASGGKYVSPALTEQLAGMVGRPHMQSHHALSNRELEVLRLIAGGAQLDEEILRIRTDLDGVRHIFNLGHGIRPETPIAHVERLVERVRAPL